MLGVCVVLLNTPALVFWKVSKCTGLDSGRATGNPEIIRGLDRIGLINGAVPMDRSNTRLHSIRWSLKTQIFRGR